jgi:2,4-dienoyl-CoA reductase (NADPH2)
MTSRRQALAHRRLTDAVHVAGGRVLLQILHAGRYAYHPLAVSASAGKSPISKFAARALTTRGVQATVDHFARCAELAQLAGYDGVEVMGSEGYLINQFLAERTNRRRDEWGGSPQTRRRLPVEVVRAVRAAVGEDAVISYRISLIDLVEGGQAWADVVALGQEVEAAGATLLSAGIGWHESRVPTIVTSVPRAAFSDLAGRLRREVGIPVAASNRISMPDDAEAILARGDADLVAMARPWLADPQWISKAAAGRATQINTCIACNQACLDHTFANRRISCLVNPRAAHELELRYRPATQPRRIAVVGAGPAGLACATVAAGRGHRVVLFEESTEIGGQFDLARRVPGKGEFAETLRYFRGLLDRKGVDVRLGHRVTAAELLADNFDEIVLATGVTARRPPIPGIDHPKVVGYADVLRGKPIGDRVAVIGAGGVGIDVAEFLTHPGGDGGDDTRDLSETLVQWRAEWGVGDPGEVPGGLVPRQSPAPGRRVYLLQRGTDKPGARLGRTSAWVRRATLTARQVEMISGVTYERIDDDGLHLRIDDAPRLLDVDHVVIAAGQEPCRDLYDALAPSASVHLVGGADVAAELDAKRAIDRASQLAARL